MRYGTIGFYRTGGKQLVFNSIIVKNNHPCEIRNSCLGANGMLGNKEIYMYGNSFIIINSNFHEPFIISNRTKLKSVYMKTFINFGAGKQYRLIYETGPKEDNRGNYTLLPIEISIGIYFGIRLGFNLSELADFLVGFIGFDPLDDDVAGIPQPIIADKEWERRMDGLDRQINKLKTPIISMEKSKFFKENSQELFHCTLGNTCINFKINKYPKCNNYPVYNEKCWDKNIIAFCQFPDYEKIYLYEDGHKTLDELETDCKSLNGKFVK